MRIMDELKSCDSLVINNLVVHEHQLQYPQPRVFPASYNVCETTGPQFYGQPRLVGSHLTQEEKAITLAIGHLAAHHRLHCLLTLGACSTLFGATISDEIDCDCVS